MRVYARVCKSYSLNMRVFCLQQVNVVSVVLWCRRNGKALQFFGGVFWTGVCYAQIATFAKSAFWIAPKTLIAAIPRVEAVIRF